MQYLNAQKFTGVPLRPLSSALLIIIGLIAITLTPRTGQAIEFKPSPQLTIKKAPQPARFIPPSKTSVRIWDGRGEYGKEHFQCVEEAVTSVPSVDKMKAWWVMWSTEETGFSKAIYQISLFPFPETLQNWQSPPGLLKTGNIQKRTETERQPLFTIDLATLVPATKPSSQQAMDPSGQLQPLSSAKKSLILKEKILPKKADIRSTLQHNRPDFQQTTKKPVFSLAEEQPLAISFYVRIVTLNAAGQLAAMPSKAAKLHITTLGESQFVWYGDPNPNPEHQELNSPRIRIVSYEPYQPYMSDWDRMFIVTKDMPMFGYTKGQELFFPRDDGSRSGWEAVSDAIGSIAGFVVDSVNRVANAYNSLKQKALDLAISLAKNTVGCGKTCQQAFSVGLDYGLAALGMPPSLPDFDAMMSMGKDYIIAEIASETSPYLSEEDVKAAVNHLESEVRKTADNGSDGSKWLRLNPKYQYRDAMLLLEVSNPTSTTTDKISCRINQFQKAFDFPFEPKDYYINIPPVRPGQTIQVPIMLRPNNVQCNNGKGMLMRDWNRMMDKGVLLQVYPSQNEQVVIKR
ncbi:hypothetical protein CR161_10425 [Prosthecochloris sp. ZM]|uniref:hypothetical protein n=1 Tax=Prosthecochloris sp. ZM TaxID=2283143 RepID=UPI000DF822BB|nr:hypothetical protein [Prosthecochloris sp. ZM]RDD31602.1 hypothetical protein CR161_10425 [Prosthecochloris sp. ZM]